MTLHFSWLCEVQHWPFFLSQLRPSQAIFQLLVVGFCCGWTKLLDGFLPRWLTVFSRWLGNCGIIARAVTNNSVMSSGTFWELLHIHPGAEFLGHVVHIFTLTSVKLLCRNFAPAYIFTTMDKVSNLPISLWKFSIIQLSNVCQSTVTCINLHFCNYQLFLTFHLFLSLLDFSFYKLSISISCSFFCLGCCLLS